MVNTSFIKIPSLNNRISHIIIALAAILLLTSHKPTVKKGMVKISFKNLVQGFPMLLNDSIYRNPFGEAYSISRFKYYISHITLSNGSFSAVDKNGYHLVDESKPGSLNFSFEAAAKKYTTISFMIGVDSLRNVSGAQTGALDPRNDMFWTWNSGYIMFKFEGNSPVSAQVNNKIQYHVGGFAGPNSVLRTVSFMFPPDQLLDVKESKISELVIEADASKWWQYPNDIRIADNAVSMTPGPLAKKMADNYSKLFALKKIVNP